MGDKDSLVEMIRGVVTVVAVAVVGVYLIDRLKAREAPAEGSSYVNARGVIASATRIAKESPIMGKITRGAAGPAAGIEG